MAKLTRDDKIEIYKKRKNGQTIPSLANEYGVLTNNIKYLLRLIDEHGIEILRDGKNKRYSKDMKETMILKVLVEGQSVTSTAIEYGLSSNGLLFNWIKSYKENNYVIVEKKKGRKPHTMTKKKEEQTQIDYKSMSDAEKIKYLESKNKSLEKSNLYLEAEAEYLKKLHAVIQAKKQQQKKR